MLKKEETSWSTGVLMICTKCGKSISSSSLKEDGNPGENLKSYLKKSIKEGGDSSKYRILTSSCLDICVDGLQAVTFAAIDGKTESYTLHPEQDRKELLNLLKSK